MVGEITGKDIQIRVAGTELDFTDESMQTTNDKDYKIIDRGKRRWNMNSFIIIFPELEPDDTYEINYAEGTINFTTKKNRGEITTSGQYLPTTLVATANSHSVEKTRDFIDVTVYGDKDKREKPTTKTTTITIEDFSVLDTFFWDKLTAGEQVLLEIQKREITESYWVYLEGITVSTPINDIAKRTIKCRGAKPQ